MNLFKTFSFMTLLLCATALAETKIDSKPLDPSTLFSLSNEYSQVKISPKGDYISAIKIFEGKKLLIILDSKTKKLLHAVHFPDNAQVGDYVWANHERLVLQKEYLKGWSDVPEYHGELYAVNADGKKAKYLFGYKTSEKQLGTLIKKNTPIQATASILDALPSNNRYMLVSAIPWSGSTGRELNTEANQIVYRVDIYKGLRRKLGRAPIGNSHFLTDNEGELRFVSGTNDHIHSQLFYRQDGQWINTHQFSYNLNDMQPIAFGENNNQVYVIGRESGQTRGVYLLNVKTGDKQKISQDNTVDPSNVWINNINKKLYAVEYENGYPEYEFVDNKDIYAQYTKQLLASLPGHQIRLVSETMNSDKLIINAFNDRNPGDYYLFDAQKVKLEYLFSQKSWLDPEQMADVKPISFTARDGKTIHGYLTLPYGADAKNLPLVVNPHGGPYGVRDGWEFNAQNQLFAQQGMAVLQVNFRGSGGYGQAFEELGHQKWGTDIQYDIIDGTKDLIAQGIADKSRICIVGGSFGGYSALQSSIIDPDLFQCAIGMSGVYDLELMFNEGHVSQRKTGQAYLGAVLGKDVAQLKAMSPTHHVDKLKAKLLLIHGGGDKRAPIEQFEALASALSKQHYPFDKMVLDNEGHGFYKDEHRAQAYRKMLSFLKTNLKL
ncbi:alpha/beta hydrolase family protein [Shewanella surugensis]|uniref:S9 family peptidase n=1 Tax=Shewanella surugensis TaxID=212020 RepID=A0ABT0L7A2_9GAMM|nr:S9 family peptidase [Shewanella surugensis]MCL1123573.1 S9 family peptidase [Shewanella surugensis]